MSFVRKALKLKSSFRNFSTSKSSINLNSDLNQDEIVLIVDEDDIPMRSAPRREMRSQNLWHRSTAIFVINSRKEFIVQKRSSEKDYCPGYIDLAAGGIVGMEEDEDEGAARELYEELSIVEPNPKYAFKFRYQDDYTSCWQYVYYQLYHGKVKPQESEIDALFFWTDEKILQMIQQEARITPDGILAFAKFLPYWQDIKKKQF